jgi:prepilin-type N-terminal cleavage/methylation domain-containing protein
MRRRAFSLIELVVVIAIMLIVLALVIPAGMMIWRAVKSLEDSAKTTVPTHS